MKSWFSVIVFLIISVCALATPAKAQSTQFPGADPLVCKEGETLNSCAVVKLDPANFAIAGAGNLKITIVEDTRCPRFARCRDLGRIILKVSVIEVSGEETSGVEVEVKRNQTSNLKFDLSDGSVLNLELLAVTHKVSTLPPELFEVKIGYDFIPAM